MSTYEKMGPWALTGKKNKNKAVCKTTAHEAHLHFLTLSDHLQVSVRLQVVLRGRVLIRHHMYNNLIQRAAHSLILSGHFCDVEINEVGNGCPLARRGIGKYTGN